MENLNSNNQASDNEILDINSDNQMISNNSRFRSNNQVLYPHSDNPVLNITSKILDEVLKTVEVNHSLDIQIKSFYLLPIIRYANTYKLDSDHPFNVGKVETIIKEVLIEALEDDFTYDPENCPNKAKYCSGTIRDRIKEENYDRYKIICLVTIGEKKSQDMYTVIKFLWDMERDHYAHFFHENMHVYIAAVVFGIYYE